MTTTALARQVQAWTSTPLARATFGAGDDALVQVGHAIRDEFVVAAGTLDDAIAQAGRLANEPAQLWGSPTNRAVAVLQADDGTRMLAGLSTDPWHPERAGAGLMESHGGRWMRQVDVGGQRRPTMLTNQATSPRLVIDGPLDRAAPTIDRLHDDVVAVVGQAGRAVRFAAP